MCHDTEIQDVRIYLRVVIEDREDLIHIEADGLNPQ